MKVVSARAMEDIDRRAQREFSFPSIVLMEDAGTRAWDVLRRLRGGRTARALFVAGRGNNGGDALVMARCAAALPRGPAATVVLAAGEPHAAGDPARMLAMVRALGIPCLSWPSDAGAVRAAAAAAGLIVDGIAGTGLRGALEPPLDALVEVLNAAPGERWAVDVPSGLGDGWRRGFPVVRADATLAMGLPKACLYLPRARALCGRIAVVPVGFPPALLEEKTLPGEMLTRSAWRGLAARVPADAHKNSRGHLAVFAGSPGTTGAAWLSATAAARSGPGLVTLFADPETWPVLAHRCGSVMCRPWRHGDGAWDPAGCDAVLAGPGWGRAEARDEALAALLAHPGGGVVDADGLAVLGRLAARGGASLGGRWVLTPHPGEFARLAAVDKDALLDDPVPQARALAAALDAVVVLKGHCTIVASPAGRFWILDGANPALATGGAGDVLAGIIAAGKAAGLPALEAALFGVSLHSHVARAAAARGGFFLAEDLLPALSRALGRAAAGGAGT